MRYEGESLKHSSVPDYETAKRETLKDWRTAKRAESKERISQALDEFIERVRLQSPQG
ncbi:MAG: hypothetical protein KME38_24125 [Spirirestis rafaelensis WJT71-NPBG6]|nr:hypothetical protein [Spirirestis rafaelensis WJT71-NPBG6]